MSLAWYMCLKTFYCPSERAFSMSMLLKTWKLTSKTTLQDESRCSSCSTSSLFFHLCSFSLFPCILCPHGNWSAKSSLEAQEPRFATLLKLNLQSLYGEPSQLQWSHATTKTHPQVGTSRVPFKHWGLRSTLCPKEFPARTEEEQEVRWSAAKANSFREHWCIMYILLFPLCRILIGFPGKKIMQHMNILGLSGCRKCSIWMGWAHRTSVAGAGWNPRQVSDIPNTRSLDLRSETHGLAEKTWGNINLPHPSLLFISLLWCFIRNQGISF